MTVILAEEVLGSVLNAAEHLQGSVVAAEPGAIEALRWAGALPLLLRDFGVTKIVSTDDLWVCRSGGHVAALLRTPRWGEHLQPESEKEPARVKPIGHLCVLVTGFLWDYDTRLTELLQLGAVQRLTVCSSLSERAHECYDFDSSALFLAHSGRSRKMDFQAFANALGVYNTCAVTEHKPPQQQHSQHSESVQRASTIVAAAASGGDNASDDGEDDDWGWNDDSSAADKRGHGAAATATGTAVLSGTEHVSSSLPPFPLATVGVNVVHLPLHFAPLLSSKAPALEPSLFVLCHPLCAAAFPLLLGDVVGANSALATSAGGALLAGGAVSGAAALPTYAHVRDVQPEHIPSAFRRSLKLLSHTLGEMLVAMRLDFKERIFAHGATSLKIGHTLQRIVSELQEDMSIHTVQGHQAASVVIIDRTSDLATPTSFGISLLDRILALLPQTPTAGVPSSKTRKDLHVTEIFPLHGCEPSPLGVSRTLLEDELVSYQTSAFLANVRWKGGASLCHPTIPSGASVFRSLAFRPAKLALRDLDKRLQAIEHELVQQRKITKTGSTRRAGEKKPSARGRDVVLRRVCNILEAGEPTSAEHSSLIELAVLILETLERMERGQQRWDKCRERATRQLQLREQNGREWILPELADAIQRRLAATVGSASDVWVSLPELLTLLVHAFALSSGSVIEEYTLQMVCTAVTESILESAVTSPESVETLFPELFVEIVAFVTRQRTQQQQQSHAGVSEPSERVTHGDTFDDEGWDWNDSASASQLTAAPGASSAPSHTNEVLRLEAKVVVEAFVNRLLEPLKECAQLAAKTSDDEFASTESETPRSLLAQLCGAVANPTTAHIPELEHIVDASEQLTRAGIDLLKSGFSRFGFGSGASASRSGASSSQLQQLAASKVVVIFVVGGITFEEIQQVHDALGEGAPQQIILGGTTITNNEIIVEQLFKSLKL